MQKLTPAMQQYVNIKQSYKDCILFFRMWDFYETFFEDAEICSKTLEIVLTSKNRNSENPIPMSGIPFHSAEKYINKLIKNWYKIAIAEQTTQPIPWKIVEREVVSVITPWTRIWDNDKNFNHIMSIVNENTKNWQFFHICRWDFSLWEYHTKTFNSKEDLQKFITIINPNELILDMDLNEKNNILTPIQQYIKPLISIDSIPTRHIEFIQNFCQIQSTNSFWQALEEWRSKSFSLLLNYLKKTKKITLTNFVKVSFHTNSFNVLLDDITIKNLEIFKSMYDSNEKHSLLWVIDNTKTAWWFRLLKRYLSTPINNISTLNQRLWFIEYFIENYNYVEILQKLLSKINDIPKIISYIIYKKILPTMFIKLRQSLWIVFENNEQWKILEKKLIYIWLEEKTLNNVRNIFFKLKKTLKEDELINDEINFISDWHNEQIDNLRKIVFHSDNLLLEYQKELKEKSWISNVKIKFIKNQWYFIEITNKDLDKFNIFLNNKNIEKKYILQRRNTLKWAQRFTSSYLDNIENEILTSKNKLINEEFKILENLKTEIEKNINQIHIFYEYISKLDVFLSNAFLAKNKKYTKPILNTKNLIKIEWWRHPVIEKFLNSNDEFIPNNLKIWKENEENFWLIHIITWPNMWGKSTFLRQNALIVLLAHCGFFIPAKNAKIWLVDGIFARVWSWDNIVKNQSTFMTEMIEVANILNNATKKSFIIFDELWRWTSTYDWLALTKSILEFLIKNTKSKTLLATHYHELIDLEKNYPEIKNFSVSVYETEKDVIFLKKIAKWGANKSYWIDVAKLAWINSEIINLATEHLKNLQQKSSNKQNITNKTLDLGIKNNNNNENLQKIKSILETLDINNITPIQAFQILIKIISDIK